MAKMDRFELVSIHTSHPVPRDPSAAALGVDGRPRQILILSERIRGGKGLNVRVYKYDIFLFGLLFIAPGTVGSRLVAAF